MCTVATTGNLDASYAVINQKPTLTMNNTGVLTIDGLDIDVGDVILVKDQVFPNQNAVYQCYTRGDVGVAAVLVLYYLFSTPTAINNCGIINIQFGDINQNSGWVINAIITVIGVDQIEFDQIVNQRGSTSITTVGTVTTGTWQATPIAGQFGGTGVANTGKTITLGGNLTTSGANALTLTTTGPTNVTLPTSGTLATTASTVSSVSGTTNRITSTGGTTPVIDISASYVGQTSITTLGTIATGTWNGTVVSPTYGGTGVNNGSSTMTLAGNVSFSGAFSVGFTATGSTALTLPTSGTLATTQGLPLSAATTNQTMVRNNAYYTNNGSSLVVLGLPNTGNFSNGDSIAVYGFSVPGWQITIGSPVGSQIYIGNKIATSSISSTAVGDCVTLRCLNSLLGIWMVTSFVGNLTVV